MNVIESSPNLIDLIAEEFVARYRRGERPAIADYEAQYPGQAEAIRELFPALVVMERLKPATAPGPTSNQAECAREVATLGRLGDYRIVREIGRGGMGIVYEAVQESLGRKVALKVLPKQPVRDESRQSRFDREARAAARLHHTNIVPVFGVGAENGLHYYAMQYIHGLGLDEVLRELKRLKGTGAEPSAAKGDPAMPPGDEPRQEMTTTLTQALFTGQFPPADCDDAPRTAARPGGSRSQSDTAKGRLSHTVRLSDSPSLSSVSLSGKEGSGRCSFPQSVARLGVQVGQALDYAHEQGVLHRDVKPSNLLLDSHGTLWVTDFGLAKSEDRQDLTQTGDVLGTLRYMAPEMFSGKADRRSDVYSLGLTLYELLALRPAFDEPDRGRLIRLVLNESPPRLRNLDPWVPRDLETIVHKAIDREPSHRYATAQDLADDLTRFLHDEPIHARRVSLTTRFSRWCKRNPAVASLTSAIAILLFVATGVSLAAAMVFADERDKTEDALEASSRKSQELQVKNDELEKERKRAEENHRQAREAVDRLLTRVAQDLADKPHMEEIRRALLEDALEFYQTFLKQKSHDHSIRMEAALAEFRVAEIERLLARGNHSIASYDRAQAALQRLAEASPQRSDIQVHIARCQLRRGTALALLHRYDDATSAYATAITAWLALVKQSPHQPSYVEELARAHYELGHLWIRRYFFAKGHEYAAQSRQLLNQMAEDFPNYPVDPALKLGVPDLLRSTEEKRGTVPEALHLQQTKNFWVLPHDPQLLAQYEHDLRTIVDHWERLAEAHPSVPTYQKQLQKALSDLGRVLLAMDRFEEVERIAWRVNGVCKRLVADYPEIPEYRVAQAWNHFDLGGLLQFTGRREQAIDHFRAALEIAKKLTTDYPNEPRHLIHYAGMLTYCPASQFRDPERAIEVYRRVMQLVENPGEWLMLGLAQMRAGQYDQALESCRRSRELGGPLPLTHLVESFVYAYLDRIDDARKHHRAAIDTLDTTPNQWWYILEVRTSRVQLEELLSGK